MATEMTLPEAGGSGVSIGSLAPPGGESEWLLLLRKEARARANYLRLAERRRAAKEAMAPKEFGSVGDGTHDEQSWWSTARLTTIRRKRPKGAFAR